MITLFLTRSQSSGLTLHHRHSIVTPMENEPVTRKTERYITALEERVDELIRVYDQLLEENRSLQAQQAELLRERDALIEQNEQSRMRIEAMVVRLKGLEQTP